jgi:hypothetical protein
VTVSASRERDLRGLSHDFDEKLTDWQCDRSIETAGEVVSAGLVLGAEQEALQAAHFIIEHQQMAGAWRVDIANSLLSNHRKLLSGLAHPYATGAKVWARPSLRRNGFAA